MQLSADAPQSPSRPNGAEPDPGLAALTTEFAARWHLPSDHLPIGVRIGSLSVVSWNVLNHAFLKNLRHFTPFFSGTAMNAECVPASDVYTITVREQRAAAMVQDMASKFDVILLQECGGYFLRELEQRLPSGRELLRGVRSDVKTDICAIINTARVKVDYQNSEFIESAYTLRDDRAIMNLALESASGERLRILHSHIPGEPSYDAQREFARYAKPICSAPVAPVLVAGDLNIPEQEARGIFAAQGMPQFVNLNALNTTAGSGGDPKRIDQFFLFGPLPVCTPIPPREISPEAARTASFLNPGIA